MPVITAISTRYSEELVLEASAGALVAVTDSVREGDR